MKTYNFYALVEDLKKWAETSDPHVRAAVKLLIEHEDWIRNPRFVSAAVHFATDGAYIVWRKAREAFDDGAFNVHSTSQLAVLDLAIILGENRFKLNLMGEYHARVMAAAFVEAAHVDPVELAPVEKTEDAPRGTGG